MALVPLFDENMAVRAYSIFSQKDNFFLNPMMLGTGQNDGATMIEGLELIEKMGIETLSEDKEIFVPVSSISVFTDVEAQCSAPHDRIVFLIDNTIPPVEMYINRLAELKEKGYKLALRKLAVSDFENWREIFKLADYVFLNHKKVAVDKAGIYFKKLYPHIRLCAGGIDNQETFEELKQIATCELYEGDFYRVPVTKGDHEVSPLKVNYIQLLNLVNDDNFELSEAADIIGRDPALTISLLRMVNTMTINGGISSIRHAAAMLGQKELKKWINTAVVNELCADRPGEITRLSLLRAKLIPDSQTTNAKRSNKIITPFSVSWLSLCQTFSKRHALTTVYDTGSRIGSCMILREAKNQTSGTYGRRRAVQAHDIFFEFFIGPPVFIGYEKIFGYKVGL